MVLFEQLLQEDDHLITFFLNIIVRQKEYAMILNAF